MTESGRLTRLLLESWKQQGDVDRDQRCADDSHHFLVAAGSDEDRRQAQHQDQEVESEVESSGPAAIDDAVFAQADDERGGQERKEPAVLTLVVRGKIGGFRLY